MELMTGTILLLVFSLLPLLLVVIVAIFVIRMVRRMEQRADERLRLDKENVAFQQQQMNEFKELNLRLTNIETILKDVN